MTRVIRSPKLGYRYDYSNLDHSLGSSLIVGADNKEEADRFVNDHIDQAVVGQQIPRSSRIVTFIKETPWTSGVVSVEVST